jgi:hypothetical protein
MTYPEPPTIEDEVDFKVEGAGKPCKTVRNNLLGLVSRIAFPPSQSFEIRILANQTVLGLPFRILFHV